jgi:hypothetical protein
MISPPDYTVDPDDSEPFIHYPIDLDSNPPITDTEVNDADV